MTKKLIKLAEKFVVAIIIFSGCTNSSQVNDVVKNDYYTVDVKSAIEKKQKILLSEITSDITYIPLETLPDILLSNIQRVRITKSYIFVMDNRDKLFQFNREGKFIRRIGRIGHGPGEYTALWGFDADEKSDIIYASDPNIRKLSKYNMSGKYEGDGNSFGSYFLFVNSARLSFYRRSYPNSPVNLIITDENLNVIHQFINRTPKPKSRLGRVRSPLYVFENKLYFKEHHNDTLFQVQDSSMIPHVVFEEKDMIMDLNIEFDLLNVPEKFNHKISNESIFESRKYIFITYKEGSGVPGTRLDYINLLLDKQSENICRVDSGLFSNDIDGGMNLWPINIYNDNTILCYVESFKIKALVASEAFKTSTPKYPEKKKALEKLANSLNENDNPVLMLVKLKE